MQVRVVFMSAVQNRKKCELKFLQIDLHSQSEVL